MEIIAAVLMRLAAEVILGVAIGLTLALLAYLYMYFTDF